MKHPVVVISFCGLFLPYVDLGRMGLLNWVGLIKLQIALIKLAIAIMSVSINMQNISWSCQGCCWLLIMQISVVYDCGTWAGRQAVYWDLYGVWHCHIANLKVLRFKMVAVEMFIYTLIYVSC